MPFTFNINSYALILCTLPLLYITLHLVLRKSKMSKLPLPPGPPGYPLLGNIYDIGSEEWKTYKKLSERYNSDVIYMNMCGTPLIVINTMQAAKELFERRSLVYSDRPRFTMMNELMGFDWHIAFMPYGERWREYRKLFRREFQPPATLLHRPLELSAARGLLVQLLDSPEQFERHLRHMAGRIILSAAYGITVQPTSDPYITIAEKALHAMITAGNAGTYLVDVIPALKYLPEFLPGMGFKKQARVWREVIDVMPVLPFEFVRKGLADGTAKSSIASRVLEEMESDGVRTEENEIKLRNVLATMYAAGADSTVSSLHTFILAMLKYPSIQKKAQRAVDEVIGSNPTRLPDFTDYGKIPYVDAVVKEVLRWKPVTPLAVPHRSTVDDIYKGYYIPAGSVVVGNTWAMLYDESTYGPNTDQFNPERFLSTQSPDSDSDSKTWQLNPNIPHPDVAFGFGRRQCAGQDMAETSIWITVVSILACFDIDVGESGEEPEGGYTSGLYCYPLPFECVMRPRDGREALIRELVYDLDVRSDIM